MWDTLTLGERSLLEIGRHDRARETRILWLVSAMDVDADVAAEVFYLEPRGAEEA